MKKRIVVLISGHGSNLQALIDACQNSTIHGDIVAVIADNPQAYGLQRARKADITAISLDFHDFDRPDEFESVLLNTLHDLAADLVVLAGFMRILSPRITKAFHGKMLNIHPSLLPRHKGLHTHQRVLESGDMQHGCTVHFVTEELDGGPIVLQARTEIEPDDTPESLQIRVQRLEHSLLPKIVSWFCQNKLTLQNNEVWIDDQVILS